MFQTCFISPLCLHYKLPRCLILRLKMFIPTSVPVYSKLHTHTSLQIYLISTALQIIGTQQRLQLLVHIEQSGLDVCPSLLCPLRE